MKSVLTLSPGLLQAVAEGDAVLFLGAGASYGATSADKRLKAPTGVGLGSAIADEFLGGRRKSEPLAKVADYAASQRSQLDLQLFIKSQLEALQPTDAIRLIPKFRWRAIVTTNYDTLIEQAYSMTPERLQNPVPIIVNGDVRNIERVSNPVPIFKLHGCITRSSDTNIPLVVANEQYAKYRSGRERLATSFMELAKDHRIVFCGYNLGDAHISQIMFSLEEGFVDRPTYTAENPAFDDLDQTYWSKYRVETISATFAKFIGALDSAVPAKTRVLAGLITGVGGSLARWLKVGARLSNGAQAILQSRLQHIYREMPVENPSPDRFYRGDSGTWSPIANGLDFKRSASYQVIAAGASDREAGCIFILIKGHAGSGKSVVLKQIGWEICGPSYNGLVLFSDSGLSGVKDVLEELCSATGERIFVLVDDALLDPAHLNDCVELAKQKGLPITFICCARGNEWNISEHVGHLIPTDEYTVGDLSRKEAVELIGLLGKYNCLGALAGKTEDEQVNTLLEEDERQLLVALHEATSGKNNFRKILLSEYKNILPLEAQILYLDICSLNRLKVPVRAGLISRMSGTAFHAFNEKFFRPLEKVVSVFSDPLSRDFAYRARHPEIAQIVFDEVLTSPEARANQIARVLASLNADYSSDDQAASMLLKGRMLADEFGDRSLVERIFDAAQQSGLDRSFVLQQRAVFELAHPGGSEVRALRLIDEAITVCSRAPGALHHTRAVVLRALARSPSTDRALADRYREQALSELRDHGQLRNSRYGITTYCEILLDQVNERLELIEDARDRSLGQEVVVQKMGDLERSLEDATQRYPDDERILMLRAELFRALDKNPRALATLRSAFERLPANEAVALRLARQLMDANAVESTNEAREVLRRAVAVNSASKRLNYQLARLLMKENEFTHRQEIAMLLRRSFTPGDTHFDAQFWCARHEFLYGERSRAKEIYDRFSKQSVPYVDADERRGLVRDDRGNPRELQGTIKALKGDFGFVACPALNDTIFLHRTQFRDEWALLRVSDPLSFKVAFSFRGPVCVDANPL